MGKKGEAKKKREKRLGAYVTADCCELRKGNFFYLGA